MSMNGKRYQVTKQGTSVGSFTFEELQAGRLGGEFDGAEEVREYAGAGSMGLDRFLAQGASAAGIGQPKGATFNPYLVFGVTGVLVLVMLGVGIFVAVRFSTILRRSVTTASVKAWEGANHGTAYDVASQPIVAGSNTLTDAKLNEIRYTMRSNHWIAAFEKSGDHTRAWNAEATEFLKIWTRRESDDRAFPDKPSNYELGARLATNADCTDPVVLTTAALTMNELHEEDRLLDRAMQNYPSTTYGAYQQLLTIIYRAKDARHDYASLSTLDRQALRLLKQYCREEQPKDEQAYIFLEGLMYGWGKLFFERNEEGVCRVLENAGPAFAWIALTARGEHELNLAWKVRGGGWASTVTDEGWRGFEAHSQLASEALLKAWKMNEKLPTPAYLMMKVGMTQNSLGDMRTWFDRCVNAQIDYDKAYSELRWGLRPRWFGDVETMRVFGETILNTGRFDTDVPRKYYDVVWDLQQENETPRGKNIFDRPDIWPNLQKMYEGYLKEPETDKIGWGSSYALVAYLAGHYDVARKQLERMDWKPAARNMSGWNRDVSMFAEEVAARTGAAAAQVTSAEEDYEARHDGRALQVYHELVKDKTLDQRARRFIQTRIDAMNYERQFDSGDWVDFLPKGTNDGNWVTTSGTVNAVTNGMLEITSGKEGHMAFCRARVEPNFEVKGEFDVVKSTKNAFQAGVILGLPDFEFQTWYGFRLKKNDAEGEVVTFAMRWSRNEISEPVSLNNDHNTFDFRLQNGRVTAFVNGKRVFNQVKTPQDIEVLPNNFFAGVGAYHDMNDETIRYRNLQIRKLSGAE